uniref:Auxin-induced protein 5NG4 n=1 Tax=Aegilops tauschii TaxID=37682 RepID=N1QVH0_AEGTA
MGMGWGVVNDVKPYLAMVLLQVGFAGMNIVAVSSLKGGMSHFVLVVYRNIVATAFMAPFALYFERWCNKLHDHHSWNLIQKSADAHLDILPFCAGFFFARIFFVFINWQGNTKKIKSKNYIQESWKVKATSDKGFDLVVLIDYPIKNYWVKIIGHTLVGHIWQWRRFGSLPWERRPKMTTTIFIKIMWLAFLEYVRMINYTELFLDYRLTCRCPLSLRPVLDQNVYFMGAKLTSAGFSTALLNTLPAVTFVLALILRMEKVRLRSLHSQAKIAGTVLTVAGAVLMVLYHGPALRFPWTKGHHHATIGGQGAAARDWLVGTIMLIASCMIWPGFFILQANTLRSYPAELSLTALICGMGSLMSGAVALVAERANTQVWAIGFDNRLFTVVYGGIVCSGVAYYLQGVVSRQRGPVFVTAFSPLSMVITAVMGSIILKEEITLGSVIGAVIIVSGLYFLIWGKSKDAISPSQVSDVSVKGAGELPLTSVTNGHGHGKQCGHAHGKQCGLGNGNGGHVDVETPTTNGHC